MLERTRRLARLTARDNAIRQIIVDDADDPAIALKHIKELYRS